MLPIRCGDWERTAGSEDRENVSAHLRHLRGARVSSPYPLGRGGHEAVLPLGLIRQKVLNSHCLRPLGKDRAPRAGLTSACRKECGI